jgi:hypothetical protein
MFTVSDELPDTLQSLVPKAADPQGMVQSSVAVYLSKTPPPHPEFIARSYGSDGDVMSQTRDPIHRLEHTAYHYFHPAALRGAIKPFCPRRKCVVRTDK